MILCSPTEREANRNLLGRIAGTRFGWEEPVAISSLVEKRGVDYLWRGHGGWYGVQRKTADDLVASVQDDRLAREIGQMVSGVVLPMIGVEGRMRNWAGKVTEEAFEKMLLSVQYQGVAVRRCRDASDLYEWLCVMYEWSQRAHSTGMVRPKPAGDWGKVTNVHWQSHMLQGLPGIGPELANRIVETVGNPLGLRVPIGDLAAVKGVGPKTIARIVEVFG